MLIFYSLLKKAKKTVKNQAILFSGLLIMIGLIFAITFVEKYNGSTMFQSIWDGVWWGVITAATIGYGDKFPTSFLGQILAIVYICISLGIFTQLISLLIEFIFINNYKKMSGTYEYSFKNHIVLFGANDAKTFGIIKQLLGEDAGWQLILVTTDTQIPNEIKEFLSKHENIAWVSGSPENILSLKNANLDDAKSAILLTIDGSNDKIVSSVLFLKQESPNLKLVVDISDNKYRDIIKKAGADVIINTEEISSNLLFRSLTDRVNVLFEELLDNTYGHETFLVNLKKEYVWVSTLAQIKKQYTETSTQIVAVLRNDGKIIFDNKYVISTEDKAFIFAEQRMIEV